MDAMVEFLVKLTLAIFLGGAIGLERSVSNKSAGFRTMILICMSSTLFIKIGMYMLENQAVFGQISMAVIVGNTIAGIGFLGAGAIIKNSGEAGMAVEGLTTAATIWFVSGIGLLIGGGLYAHAIIATVYALVILLLFGSLEKSVVSYIKVKAKRKRWF